MEIFFFCTRGGCTSSLFTYVLDPGWMRLMFTCVLDPGWMRLMFYVRAWALGCFYSHISTRTFRRALTTSADGCTEKKNSAPSVA